jgi:hypothetical protein
MTDLTIKDLQPAYHAFFLQNEAGKYFMETLLNLIESNHEAAEKTPDYSRDYVQRAKGIREVLEQITVVINTPIKEIKPKE